MRARPFEAEAAGIRLRVRLTPRGGRDAIEGVTILADGRTILTARVRAAPEKGAANQALEMLIAKNLGVPKTAVSVIAGGASRLKTVRVAGEPDRLIAAIEALGCG